MPEASTLVKKTVLITGYRCNNRCRFCIDSEKRNLPEKTTEQMLREIAGARRSGTTYLELIGGESTIRPDIIELVAFAKAQGFDTILMATNGRMYAYRPFAERVLEAGITDVVFSIHGPDAAVHDGLTRSPGSFQQLLKGIENLRSLGFERLASNTTVVRPNVAHLPALGELLVRLGIRSAEFIFVDPNYGGALRDFRRLVPRISQAAPGMRRCLDAGRAAGRDWHARYVPLCHFQGYEDQVSELREVRTFRTEHLAPDFVNRDVEGSRRRVGRAKTERCRGCARYDACEGIWVEYLKRYGDGELSPARAAG